MTKNEIAEFLGYTHMTSVAWCFRQAEQECPSILAKKGHYNKNIEVDYTLEETLIALKYLSKYNNGIPFTPAMERVLIENFIHRDVPYK